MRIHREWKYFLLASQQQKLPLGLGIVLCFSLWGGVQKSRGIIGRIQGTQGTGAESQVQNILQTNLLQCNINNNHRQEG